MAPWNTGRPERPKTLEALIVHQVDDLDAKVNAFQEFIRNAQDESSDWTPPFHRLLDTPFFLYKGKTWIQQRIISD